MTEEVTNFLGVGIRQSFSSDDTLNKYLQNQIQKIFFILLYMWNEGIKSESAAVICYHEIN